MNKILIADEDKELCEVAKSILDIFGYDIVFVSSLEEIEKIEWKDFELILVDWLFAGDGMGVYDRALSRGYTSKVMVMSSREVGNTMRLRFEQRGIKYLPKPFSSISLSAAVEGALK